MTSIFIKAAGSDKKEHYVLLRVNVVLFYKVLFVEEFDELVLFNVVFVLLVVFEV